MALRGRHWVALWLVLALGALWLVAARQTSAFRAARTLADARSARAQLEGRKAEFERRIRSAQGRAVLLPRAEQRLGLRLPADSEIVLLPGPTPSR
jgi:hypothetical protein